MSHQHGLSNNRTETTGFTEADDGDDRVQKESENVAHARIVSNGRNSRIQGLAEFAYHRSSARRVLFGKRAYVERLIGSIRRECLDHSFSLMKSHCVARCV